MKREQILIILFITICLSSCNLRKISDRRIEENLTGRWDIISISSSEKPDSVLLKEFDSMLHTLLINAIIEFRRDHKFMAEIAGKAYSGIWEVDSRMHKIKLTEPHKESSYSMIFIRDNEMKLTGFETKQDFVIMLRRRGYKRR